jgi:hypothetical protein
MKHFRMLAAGLCSAVLLCGFAIPAYAYSDGGNEEHQCLLICHEAKTHLFLARRSRRAQF